MLREFITEEDIEIVLQDASESYPEEKQWVVSDNGPHFIARDFKEFLRISGISHVMTSPHYPKSTKRIERWHQGRKTIMYQSKDAS